MNMVQEWPTSFYLYFRYMSSLLKDEDNQMITLVFHSRLTKSFSIVLEIKLFINIKMSCAFYTCV